MKISKMAAALGVTLMAASCGPRPEAPAPAPVQTRPPAPVAPPPVRPSPPPASWQDLPLTPGAWFYSSGAEGPHAMFGAATSEAQFIVRCDRARRTVTLSREGAAAAARLTVRTSFTVRDFPAAVRTEPLAYTSATLPASDRFLDSMVFSRGRFTVDMPGAPTLVIPAWPEPARVVEECRS